MKFDTDNLLLLDDFGRSLMLNQPPPQKFQSGSGFGDNVLMRVRPADMSVDPGMVAAPAVEPPASEIQDRPPTANWPWMEHPWENRPRGEQQEAMDWLHNGTADEGSFTEHLLNAVKSTIPAAADTDATVLAANDKPSTADFLAGVKSKMPPPPKNPNVGTTIDVMRPKLNWIDPNFVPVQPQGSILAPWWPTADRVSDWLTGPPGRPQAVDDPAYLRRLEGTIPLPGVRLETERETQNRLLQNAPWLVNGFHALQGLFGK